MSYELFLLPVSPGEDPEQAYAKWVDRQTLELNAGPISTEAEAEKQRLAKALMRLNPALEQAAFDLEKLASLEDIPVEEARRRYRHLELNSDDDTGIQITLWDDAVEITFPYWHSGESAQACLQQVWEYLERLTQWTGLRAWDPQCERLLNPTRDFSVVLERYQGMK